MLYGLVVRRLSISQFKQEKKSVIEGVFEKKREFLSVS
jgi:hypothetical protein